MRSYEQEILEADKLKENTCKASMTLHVAPISSSNPLFSRRIKTMCEGKSFTGFFR